MAHDPLKGLHVDPPREYHECITVPAGSMVGPRSHRLPADAYNVRVRFIRRTTAGRRHYQTIDADRFPIDIYI